MGLGVRRIGASLHGGDGVHERARIDGEIQVGGRRQVRVAEQCLRDLQIAAGLKHALRDSVTKLMRAYGRTDFAAEQPQRRFKCRVRQRHADVDLAVRAGVGRSV